MIQTAKFFLQDLQAKVCAALEDLDQQNKFTRNQITDKTGGIRDPRVLAGTGPIEKAAVNFTHSIGDSLPKSVSDSKNNLAGRAFEAVSLSIIVHPANPFVPTTHVNLRLFVVQSEPLTWHFGGGYDLTPTYGFVEDAKNWHIGARDAAGENYRQMKEKCDDYFYLPHRDEHRGVGGLFFDDFKKDTFDQAEATIERIGKSFLPLYLEIFERRKHQSYSKQNKLFQLYRRGRYAEFNLLVDRGTKYGLESGRSVESVLASMPPLASWVYEYPVADGTPEKLLTDFFLKPKDWVNQSESPN